MSGTRFIAKKFVGTSVPPDEAKLPPRGDVHAALQDAALAAKRKTRLGGEPAIVGALGSAACTISDAHSHRGGDTHEFPATPARVLKRLGVLSAGEKR